MTPIEQRLRRMGVSLASAAVLFLAVGTGLPAVAQSTPDDVRAATKTTTPDNARLDPTSDPDASANWQKVRAGLFQSRPIAAQATDVVVLDSPGRAEDAAVVPVAIRARFDQSEARYVQKLYLIVDRNPSPVSAIFTLSPRSGRADIETRIRVEDYSFIRAVAELNDGSLHMATRFIKASGGCSAPAGRDMARAMANLGRWKLKLDDEPVPGQPMRAQLMISHPNESGLALDQVTRTYASPHFVRQVDVTYDGERVLSADIDFSISENPNFRFWFRPRAGGGELAVRFVDNRDLAFAGSIAVGGERPGGGSADPR